METDKWTTWGFSSTLKGNDLRSYADIMETKDMDFLNNEAKVLWIGNLPDNEFGNLAPFLAAPSPLVFANSPNIEHVVLNGVVNPRLFYHIMRKGPGKNLRKLGTVEFFGTSIIGASRTDIQYMSSFIELCYPTTLIIDNVKDDLSEQSEIGQAWRDLFDTWLSSVRFLRFSDTIHNVDRGFMFFLSKVAKACDSVQKVRILCELPYLPPTNARNSAARLTGFHQACSDFVESLLSQKRMIALRIPAWVFARVMFTGNFGTSVPELFRLCDFSALKLCLYWKKGDDSRLDLSATNSMSHPIRTLVLRHVHFEDAVRDTDFSKGNLLPVTLKYKLSSLRLLVSKNIKQLLDNNLARYGTKQKVSVVSIHRKDVHHAPAVWNITNHVATKVKGFGHTDGSNLYDSDNPPPSQYE
tara:strand:+ start:1576 stop:2811 length:1236 start_codon:yes stop_codon:yes gene_type:complete